jgi:hypothetical protein
MKNLLIALLFVSIIGMTSCNDGLEEIQVQDTPQIATGSSGNDGGEPDPAGPPPCPTC